MEVIVSNEEMLDRYRQNLSDLQHNFMALQIAYEKAQARIREFEGALEKQPEAVLDAGPAERPERRQVARQVPPGLNGRQQDGSAAQNG